MYLISQLHCLWCHGHLIMVAVMAMDLFHENSSIALCWFLSSLGCDILLFILAISEHNSFAYYEVLLHSCMIWAQLHCLYDDLIHLCMIWALLHCLLWGPLWFLRDLSTTPFISSFLANCLYFNILTLYCWILHHLGLTLWLGMLCTVGTKLECSPPGEIAMQVSMASREPVTKDIRLKKKLWPPITTKRVLNALLIKSLLTART